MAETDGPEQISTIEQKLIEGQVIEMIKTCYDPEIPVNIYELGLIYGVAVAMDGGRGRHCACRGAGGGCA